MTKIFEIGQKVRLVGYPFKYAAFAERPHLEGRIGEVVGIGREGDVYDVRVEDEPPAQFMHPENLEEVHEGTGESSGRSLWRSYEDYPKFSPGDRVRRINHDNCEEMVVGTEWTVVAQDGAGLSLEGYGNEGFCSSSWNFELVEQSPFKVGDEVFYEDDMVSGRGEITKIDGPIAYVRVELKDASKAYFGERDRIFALADLTLIEKPLEDEKVESLPSLGEIYYGALEQRLLAHPVPSDTTVDDWYFDNDKGVEAEENPAVYFVSVPVPNGMKLESVSLTFA